MGFNGDGRPQRRLHQGSHAAHKTRQIDDVRRQILTAREGEHALGERGAPQTALNGVV